MVCIADNRCMETILDRDQQKDKDHPFEDHRENAKCDTLVFKSLLIQVQHRDRNHQVCLLNSKRAHSCAGYPLVYTWITGLRHFYRYLVNPIKYCF
jgi:hypothetical protein